MEAIVRGLSILLLSLMVFCFGCTNANNPSSSTTSTLTKFYLSGATGLMILPASSISKYLNRATTSSINEVFKVTSSGALLQVTSYDQAGQPMTLMENPGYFQYIDSGSYYSIQIALDCTANTASGSAANVAFLQGLLVAINNEQYFIGTGSSGSITRSYSATNPLGVVTGSGLTTITTAGASSSALFLAGTSGTAPELKKFDPSTGIFSTILPGPDSVAYDISSMAVASDGTILFNAQRMSDGKVVIGRVSAGGAVSIVDAKYNATVVSLIQVNGFGS